MQITCIDSTFRRIGLSVVALLAFAMGGAPRGNAAEYYVSPEGAGLADGSSWANAFDNIQDAVDAASNVGDVVYLKEGAYVLSSSLLIADKASFTISGGYLGDGMPGNLSGNDSVLKPASSGFRVVNLSNSTLRMERLTISEATGTIAGLGFKSVNSALTLTNCVVRNNTLTYVSGGEYKGAGGYVVGGSLALFDSRVVSNKIAQGNSGASVYGAGIRAESATLDIRDTEFFENRITILTGTIGFDYSAYVNYNHYAYGGGISADGGTISLQDCAFVRNAIDVHAARNATAYGGAVYMNNVTDFTVDNCTFSGCYTFADTTWPDRYTGLPKEAGGVLYVTGTCQGTVRDSIITKSAGDVRGSGGVCLNAGTLLLENCLIAAGAGNALVQENGTLTARQVTLADYTEWGLKQMGGSLTFTNGIVWGNASGGMSLAGSAAVGYTCSQAIIAGTGNVVTDPLFVLDYYLSGAGLPKQAETSPCVDTGGTTAVAAGMDSRTVRTDGLSDSGVADLGYHHAAATDFDLTALDLYVDVVGGDDAHFGTNAVSPLKTLSATFAKAVPGSTIHIAAGTYNLAGGEVFPLDVPHVRMHLRGTNREETVISGEGGSTHLMTARGIGPLILEGVTLADAEITNQYGNGLRVLGCNLLMTNAVLRDCAQISGSGTTRYVYGGALFAVESNLRIADTKVSGNRVAKGNIGTRLLFHGAGLCLWSCRAKIRDSEFIDNATYTPNVAYSYQGMGGAVYALDTSLDVSRSLFSNNTCTAWGDYSARTSPYSGTARGGAIYVRQRAGRQTAPNRIEDCRFSGNWVEGPHYEEGGTIYLESDDAHTTLVNCELLENSGVTSSGDVFLSQGAAFMTNCLIARNAGDGMVQWAGSLALIGCTIADNGKWGIRQVGGTLEAKDSIVWGNPLGGISADDASSSYTCSQESFPGNGNIDADPAFIFGYYLSVDGLPGQSVSSPCIDAGSTTATSAGMDSRTTRSDGTYDTGIVDLGYHETAGYAGNPANLVLFVDAVNGDDGNDGRSQVNALRTISSALGKSIPGTTINIATGRYDQALGEVFPLIVTQPGLTLYGENVALTIIDAADSDARVLEATAKGHLALSGLAFEGGHVSTGDAAGLRFASCQTVVSNCIVRNCGFDFTTQPTKGGGIYVDDGAFTLVSSEVSGNYMDRASGNVGWLYGAGLYSCNTLLTISGSAFLNNRLTVPKVDHYFYAHGAGLYANGGNVSITATRFSGNICDIQANYKAEAYGAALYLDQVDTFSLSESVLSDNWANGRTVQAGGALYMNGAVDGAAIDQSTISSNGWGGTDSDGGLYVKAGDVHLRSALIADNRDRGLVCAGGRTLAENCTFAGNSTWGAYNAGGEIQVHNSLVWNNVGGGIHTNQGDSVSYTLSQEPHPGTGNQSSDPLFVHPDAGDYRLQEGSPAINAGLAADWMLAALDLAGNPRILRDGVDLGAYELPPPAGTLLLLR